MNSDQDFWICDKLHYQLDVKPVFEKNSWEQTMEIDRGPSREFF